MTKLRSSCDELRFDGASAQELVRVLTEAPLVGERSIFGNRKVRSTTSEGATRHMAGFEPLPIPLLRFDVDMRQRSSADGVKIVVEMSQPDRARPYLDGQFVWLLGETPDGAAALLREEINTPIALGIVDRPLHGPLPSLRRYLFFAGGHARLMADVATNVRALLD